MKTKRIKFEYRITDYINDLVTKDPKHMDYLIYQIRSELGKKLTEEIQVSFAEKPYNNYGDITLHFDLCVIDAHTLDKCLRLLKGYGSQYSPTLIEVEELLLGVKEYDKVTGETK